MFFTPQVIKQLIPYAKFYIDATDAEFNRHEFDRKFGDRNQASVGGGSDLSKRSMKIRIGDRWVFFFAVDKTKCIVGIGPNDEGYINKFFDGKVYWHFTDKINNKSDLRFN